MNNTIAHFYHYIYGHPEMVVAITVVIILLSLFGGRACNRTMLFLYSGSMLYVTILNRSIGKRHVNLNLFWSYRYLPVNQYYQWQILYNICIFVPLGTILSQLSPKWKNLLILPLLSAGIELLQFLTARGLCELDDVVSNSIGGLIGFCIGMLFSGKRPFGSHRPPVNRNLYNSRMKNRD